MKMIMNARFQILKDGKALTKDDINSMSLGGYYFVVNDSEIPFDFEDYFVTELDNVFEMESGSSCFGSEYELADYYHEDYEFLGLTIEDITAKFLASTTRIADFHINYMDNNGEEVNLGDNFENEYRVKLYEVNFTDYETGEIYKVDQEVLEVFNNK